MDGELGEGLNKADGVFDSIDRTLGLEKPADTKVIYQYLKQGERVLWIDLLTKEKPFKSWHYNPNSFSQPEDIQTIPASNTRSVIHFFPLEAREAFDRDENRTFWLDDENFRGKRILIAKSNITAFTDLLNAIRNGELGETNYIIGETNLVMAKFAQSLGFSRCWEDGYAPLDPALPIRDEDMQYKLGVSVAELVGMYDLNNQVPIEQSVFEVIRKNKAKNRNLQKTS